MNGSDRKKTLRSILVFILLVTGLAFTSPLLGNSPSSFSPGFLLWGSAPLLAAVLMRISTKDWSDAGFKPVFRKNTLWYLGIILAYPVIFGLTVLTANILSIAAPSGFTAVRFLKIFLAALPAFFIFAICEEVGWRGYFLPKLVSVGMNDYLISAIVAVVWATWHLPFINQFRWMTGGEDTLAFIPRFYLAMFALTILYNEARLITGSVWAAVLIHCFANSVGHPLMAYFIKITPGYAYLASFNGLLMILFTSLLGIALNRWRVRKIDPIKNHSAEIGH